MEFLKEKEKAMLLNEWAIDPALFLWSALFLFPLFLRWVSLQGFFSGVRLFTSLLTPLYQEKRGGLAPMLRKCRMAECIASVGLTGPYANGVIGGPRIQFPLRHGKR